MERAELKLMRSVARYELCVRKTKRNGKEWIYAI